MLRSPNDLLLGLALAAAASVGLWATGDLRIGTPARMGPGFFPVALCWLLLGLGLVIGLQALVVRGEPAERWPLRPLGSTLAAVAVFGLGVERFGLLTVVFATVLVAGLGHEPARTGELVLLGLFLAAICGVVFVGALGLPMPLWPAGLR